MLNTETDDLGFVADDTDDFPVAHDYEDDEEFGPSSYGAGFGNLDIATTIELDKIKGGTQ